MLRAEPQRCSPQLRGNTDEVSHRDAVCLHNRTSTYIHTHTHTRTRTPARSCHVIYVFFYRLHTPGEACRCSRARLFTLSELRLALRATQMPGRRALKRRAASADPGRGGARRLLTGAERSRGSACSHSKVIRLHGGLYKWLLKLRLTRCVFRSSVTHSHTHTHCNCTLQHYCETYARIKYA